VDVGVGQADCEVGAAFAGGLDGELLEVLETHVPQPGEVLTVGDLSVDGDDQAVGGAVDHGQGFLPSGGVLGQQEVDLVVAVGDGGVAAGDVVHAVDGIDSLRQGHAVDGGRAD